MKKQILKLGVVLEKNMQKSITGGGAGEGESADPEDIMCSQRDYEEKKKECLD